MENTTKATMLTEDELSDLLTELPVTDYVVEVKDELTTAKEWLQSMGDSLQKQLLIEYTTYEDVPQYRTEYDVEVDMYYDGEYRTTTWKAEWELTDIIRSSSKWDYSRTGNTKERKVCTGVKRIYHKNTRPMTDKEIIDTYQKECDFLKKTLDDLFNIDFIDDEEVII